MINAVIEADRVEVAQGVPEAVTLPTGSGRPHDVYRCGACRVALWSDYGRRRVLLFLRVGTLDEPAAFPPGAHIFTASKLPWVRLGDDVPVMPEYYDLPAVWPAESLARRRAILPHEA